MAHKFLNSKLLNEKERYLGAFECLYIFNCRSIAAFISKRFRFLANVEIAAATYESLSNRFILKQVGNWSSYLEYRADRLLSKDSLHLKPLIKMDDDKKFLEAIVEGSGSIRSTFNIIYGRHKDLTASKDYVKSSNLMSVMEEGALADMIRSVDNKINASISDCMIKDKYVRKDLLDLIIPLIPASIGNKFKSFLVKFTEMSRESKNSKIVNKLISSVISTSYNELRKNKLTNKELKDVGKILYIIRSILYSTRTTNEDVINLKELSSEVIMLTGFTISNRELISMKHALMLYIFSYSLLVLK